MDRPDVSMVSISMDSYLELVADRTRLEYMLFWHPNLERQTRLDVDRFIDYDTKYKEHIKRMRSYSE